MQRLTKLKVAERTGRGAIKTAETKRRGLWSTITSAVSDAFASVTGRKQAERKRKRVAAAGAAGAATVAGAAGVVLSKKRSRDNEAAREAAYQAPQPTPTSANGVAEPVSSGSDTPA